MFSLFYNINPQAIEDAPSIIRQAYLSTTTANAVVPLLNHKARILAHLRQMQKFDCNLEEQVVLLLGLCAIEVSNPAANLDKSNCAPAYRYHNLPQPDYDLRPDRQFSVTHSSSRLCRTNYLFTG